MDKLDKVDPALRDHLINLGSKVNDLKYQIEGYHTEARNATRPRRKIVGVWAAVACAWLAAGTVSVITIVSLAEQTAGTNDGKIAWVVFVAFVAAVAATFLAVVRGGD